jgi:uncharacterized protein (DUF1778 family)
MGMTQRDADYYQAHKDDPEEWGEAQPAPKSKRRRLAAMISVRFTPEEDEAVRQVAQSLGKSVSAFIRQAALKAAGVRGSHTEAVSLAALSSTKTTSFGTTTETRRGNTLLQMSVPSSVPDGVHAG